MDIKLVTGATTYEACINTIKQINFSDLELTNIVVVPDSFSMQAENLIFDILNIRSTFNIEVVGISRLASKILRKNNIPFERISGLEEIFCVYKAVKQCENDFKYFKKCDVDFCIKLLQIIKQFKACKISPERIDRVGDVLLDEKMHDLKIVYECYENMIKDKFDLSKLLDFFVENTKNNIDLSKINLHFVNFDSFSVEINSFVCKLAGLTNKTYIGMARPISQSNAFIYENDIFNKTTQLAKEYGVTVSVENFPTALKDEHLKMVKNLFSFDVERGKSDFFTNVVAKNIQDEVEFCAKYIRNRIVKGWRYKNFAVAVSNEKYFNVIKTIFSQYEIPFYCDDAVDLSETILGRMVLRFLEISKLGFNASNLQYLINLPLKIQFDKDEILKAIWYHNIQNENEFIERYPQFKNLIENIKILKKITKIKEFSLILLNILDLINFDGILMQLKDDNLFKKESENSQSRALIEEVFSKLSDLGKEENVDIFDFENLLSMSFKSVKVETIPAYVDSVYVGDATTSYFEDVDTLFVLGATANSLPRTQNDTGIIDDDDIKKLRLNFVLEPEIKVLNRRSRLKLFEVLQHAKERLIVSMPMSEDGKLSQCANFVNDLNTMFGNNIVHTLSFEDFEIDGENFEEHLDRLLFYVGTKNTFLNTYSKLKTADKLPQSLKVELCALAGDFESESFKYEVLPASKDVYSASELETYFRCPFRHFMGYDLKIKEVENVEPNKKQFGVFEHALLKKFVEEFDCKEFDCKEFDLDKFLKQNMLKIAKEVYDEKILKRNYFVEFLKNESKIILKNAILERKNSNFEPFLLEEKIFSPLNKQKYLIGFVDRVDKAKKYFRIIDYKTGKTENIKKDLFYGKKLQLFLYADAIKKRTGLDCAGVYYFNCQTKYSKINSNLKLLNGITLKENEVVELSDKRLWQDDFRSDLLGMVRKKKQDEFSYKNGNVETRFDNMLNYAVDVSGYAIEEIEQGYIEAKPFKDECEMCPYISICKHQDRDGYRKTQQIKEIKGKTDEN